MHEVKPLQCGLQIMMASSWFTDNNHLSMRADNNIRHRWVLHSVPLNRILSRKSMQNTFSLTPSSVIFSILLFFPMHSVVCACVHACVCACVHANISVEGSLKCELLRKHNFINKLHFNSGLKCEKCRQAYYVLHLTCYVKYLLTVYHHSWLRCHVMFATVVWISDHVLASAPVSTACQLCWLGIPL